MDSLADFETQHLRPNERRVLLAGARPMTAYDVLAILQAERVTAPPTVYRALKGLEARGLVHRIDSLKAYVPCSHAPGDHGHHGHLLVCTDCGQVQEVADAGVEAMVAQLAQERGFALAENRVELSGRCADCQATARAG